MTEIVAVPRPDTVAAVREAVRLGETTLAQSDTRVAATRRVRVRSSSLADALAAVRHVRRERAQTLRERVAATPRGETA